MKLIGACGTLTVSTYFGVMIMSSSSSLEKFLFGALLGGAIGALLAVLTAPRSGEETRKLLSEELSSRYDDSRKVLG
jgi:hypothetical protein